MIPETKLAGFRRVRAQLMRLLYTKRSDHPDARGLVSLIESYDAAIREEALLLSVSA